MRTERLILRNWEDRDRELFHRINSDDRVMEFFPFRRDRAAGGRHDGRVARGDRRATATVLPPPRSPTTGECIGFVGILTPVIDAAVMPAGNDRDRLAAGARVLGQGLCHRGSSALAAPSASTTLGLGEIVSFAVADNRRSTAVMQRLGMTADPSATSIIPAFPTAMPRSQAARRSTGCRAQDWQARKEGG